MQDLPTGVLVRATPSTLMPREVLLPAMPMIRMATMVHTINASIPSKSWLPMPPQLMEVATMAKSTVKTEVDMALWAVMTMKKPLVPSEQEQQQAPDLEL